MHTLVFDYRVNIIDNGNYRCFEVAELDSIRAKGDVITYCRNRGTNQNLAVLSVTYLGSSNEVVGHIKEYK